MNGVVLWSCPQTWRAIVWCDDHGHLAYARGEDCFASAAGFPSAGDLIAFDLKIVGRVRHACAIRVVERDSFPGLVRSLRDAAAHVALPALGSVASNTAATRPAPRLVAVG